MKKILLTTLLPILASVVHADEASYKACGKNDIVKNACYQYRYKKPDYVFPWLNTLALEQTFSHYPEIPFDPLNDPLPSLTQQVAEHLLQLSPNDKSRGLSIWQPAVQHGNYLTVRNDIFQQLDPENPLAESHFYVFTTTGQNILLESILLNEKTDLTPVLIDAYAHWLVEAGFRSKLDDAKMMIAQNFLEGDDPPGFPFPDTWTLSKNAISFIYQDALGAGTGFVALNVPPEKLTNFIRPEMLQVAKTWTAPPPSANSIFLTGQVVSATQQDCYDGRCLSYTVSIPEYQDPHLMRFVFDKTFYAKDKILEDLPELVNNVVQFGLSIEPEEGDVDVDWGTATKAETTWSKPEKQGFLTHISNRTTFTDAEGRYSSEQDHFVFADTAKAPVILEELLLSHVVKTDLCPLAEKTFLTWLLKNGQAETPEEAQQMIDAQFTTEKFPISENWRIGRNSLILHYPLYALGDKGLGEVELEIAASALKKFIKPEFLQAMAEELQTLETEDSPAALLLPQPLEPPKMIKNTFTNLDDVKSIKASEKICQAGDRCVTESISLLNIDDPNLLQFMLQESFGEPNTDITNLKEYLHNHILSVLKSDAEPLYQSRKMVWDYIQLDPNFIVLVLESTGNNLDGKPYYQENHFLIRQGQKKAVAFHELWTQEGQEKMSQILEDAFVERVAEKMNFSEDYAREYINDAREGEPLFISVNDIDHFSVANDILYMTLKLDDSTLFLPLEECEELLTPEMQTLLAKWSMVN